MPEEHRIIGPDSLCSFLKVLMLKVQLAFTKYETFHLIFKKPEESRMQLGALCPTLKPNKSQTGL